MDIKRLHDVAERNLQATQEILDSTGIIPAWESIGATVYLVGSLKTGLMMKNRDIDLHIYSDRVDIAESFSVMQGLAARLPLKELHYGNLIDTEEECLEWHARYDDGRTDCKIDMIHIRRGSKYDGVVERVTDAIRDKLTPARRDAVLRIKYEVPENTMVPGIDIYRAVFDAGVSSYDEFLQWREANPLDYSLDWMP